MSNIDANDAVRAGELTRQLVSLLVEADPETRRRAVGAAMMLLGDSTSVALGTKGVESASDERGEPSLQSFFNRDEDLRPAHYVQLCAAYHYAMHGSVAFSIDDLRAIGDEAGLVLPDRIDKTLSSAAKSGKRLFQAVGRGAFKPTTAAGLLFKERWGVRPGKQLKHNNTAT